MNTGTGTRTPLDADIVKPEPPSEVIKSNSEDEVRTDASGRTGSARSRPRKTVSNEVPRQFTELETPAVVIDTQHQAYFRQAVQAYYLAVQSKNDATARVYEYNNWVLENRKSVFNWQQLAGKILFGMVLLLVLTGVVFSGVQFAIAMRHANKSRGSQPDAAQDSSLHSTTLKASAAGIEISSSILGVIILVVSLLFFYLYLVHIYPITVVIG